MRNLQIYNQKYAAKPRNPTNQKSELSPVASSQRSKSKSVFIAGDDTTSVLSPRLMSYSDMVVKIKTHREGKIGKIETSLVKLAEDNRDYIINLIIRNNTACWSMQYFRYRHARLSSQWAEGCCRNSTQCEP